MKVIFGVVIIRDSASGKRLSIGWSEVRFHPAYCNGCFVRTVGGCGGNCCRNKINRVRRQREGGSLLRRVAVNTAMALGVRLNSESFWATRIFASKSF